MSRTTILISIVFLVVAVVAMFTVWYLNTSTPEEVQTNDEIPAENLDTTDQATITAKHFYQDGVHTLVGEIEMPTPCDLLEYDTLVQESFPEQVSIAFTVLNTAEMCAQVITPQRFMVEAAASEDATFSATLRGEPVNLNLIPAAPGETPDEFELFIKG